MEGQKLTLRKGEIEYLGKTLEYSFYTEPDGTLTPIQEQQRELAILEAKRNEALEQLEDLERMVEFCVPLEVKGFTCGEWYAKSNGGFEAVDMTFLGVIEKIFKQIGK